ncbi:hypothetical protein TELCIR_04655 [Teladorsagia circumcincta]|uniref:alpha-galactosidase n=1 Tax=Teladorsagia circumcincta TaxID=45464 RepID=A0A2G9UTA9_TELCI|nr:hypothetical protein TELCIR_04655 [Teladorsagia circumcincta]
MSNDLRVIAPEFRRILLNRDVIAIDQDPLGRMGRLMAYMSGISIYVKSITPVYAYDTSFAIAMLNRRNRTNAVQLRLRNLGLTNGRGYLLKNLWSNTPVITVYPSHTLRLRVPATGASMYRAELIKPA